MLANKFKQMAFTSFNHQIHKVLICPDKFKFSMTAD